MVSLSNPRKQDQVMLQEQIEQFLANGGTITEVPPEDLEVSRRKLAESFLEDIQEDEPDEEVLPEDLEDLELWEED
jgi:hypothetical protein